MAQDASNNHLKQWLKKMGYTPESGNPDDLLTEDQLSKLNSTEMRPIWRHLTKYVRPVQEVNIIKKNLLLHHLQDTHTQPGALGDVAIDSVKKCNKYMDILQTKHNNQGIRNETKIVKDNIENLRKKISERLVERENVKRKIEECYSRAHVFALKSTSVETQIENLAEHTDLANSLKLVKNETSDECDRNKQSLAKYVQKLKCSPVTGTTECDISDMVIESILTIPAKSIYEGLINVLLNAVNTLNRLVDKMNPTSDNLQFKEELAKREIVSFSENVSHLDAQLIHIALQARHFSNAVKGKKLELKEKQDSLILQITDIVDSDHSLCDNNDKARIIEQYVCNIIQRAIVSTKGLAYKSVEQEVNESELDQKKLYLSHCKDRLDTLHKEIQEKCIVLSDCASCVFNSNVTNKKELFKKLCVKVAGSFIAKQKMKEVEDNFVCSQDIVLKEVEMFQKVPLDAVTRLWDSDYELFREDIIRDLCKDPEFSKFFLQSAYHNIPNVLLENDCWEKEISGLTKSAI